MHLYVSNHTIDGGTILKKTINKIYHSWKMKSRSWSIIDLVSLFFQVNPIEMHGRVQSLSELWFIHSSLSMSVTIRMLIPIEFRCWLNFVIELQAGATHCSTSIHLHLAKQ